MIGVERPSEMDELYGKEYLDMYKSTRIGLRLDSRPKKITFFTNHRSLKRGKKPDMKPFKVDLVDKPSYTVYVKMDDDSYDRKLSSSLRSHEFAYSPYLGHAYCPATVTRFEEIDASRTDPNKSITQCVVLDESEMYSPEPRPRFEIRNDGGSVIVERHIHHFFDNGRLDGRVLKHWIPTSGSDMELKGNARWTLSEFYSISGDKVVCMY